MKKSLVHKEKSTTDAVELLDTANGDEISPRRPFSLRKTPQGGSTRLSALSDMLRRFSILDEFSGKRGASFARAGGDSTFGELFRLQNVLITELPNISRLSTPSIVPDMLVPRRTLANIEDALDAESLASPEELPEGWRPSVKIRALDFIREMALKKLESDTFNKLSVILNTHLAEMKPNNDENAPAYHPFAWTLDDFLRRRNERNIAWLDTLLLRSDKEFTLLKFKCDMDELSKLLRLIFKGLRPTTNKMVREDLYAFVHDAHDFLKFPKNFRIEAKSNMNQLREQVNTYLDMWYYKRAAEEEAYKRNLEQKLMNSAVLSPIELRYQLNWLHAKTDQAVMKLTNNIEEMEKKVENIRAEESKESYCARCALDMYYLDIESFKHRINDLSIQYDNEFDKIENEITYKRVTMDKLRAQRKYLEETMARYKEEIEHLRQKEREEQEAEEQRKLLAEQQREEEELAKKKQKKDKKKGKKK